MGDGHFTARSWVLTEEQLRNSPSRVDGVSEELEKSYGRKSCTFIKKLGEQLQVYVAPTAAAAAAAAASSPYVAPTAAACCCFITLPLHP